MSDPIKRPLRIYGKPKDTVSDEASASLQSSGPPGSSTIPISRPIASHLAEKNLQAPSSSRHSLTFAVADDQGSDEEGSDASGGFQFGWKAKMKAMDEEMSADDDDLVPAIVADASRPADNRSPTIVRSNSASRTVPNSPSLQDAPSVAQDVSGGSLSALTASSDFDAIESRTPPVSPPPAASHRRGKRRAVIHSSDEDTEDDTQGSARRSRVIPHPIASPKSRPSSTPPTSDNDLPAQIPLVNPRSKGKGKPASSRTQVPPLRFNNELAVGHKKRPSDTGPSKTNLKVSFLLESYCDHLFNPVFRPLPRKTN
jgi:mediator of replication checkpoint protein 1